MLSKGPLECKN